jgi:hypothetical protein
MLDCNQDIRSSYITALNGNITYNNVNVPVYGQTPFETTPQNYVVIGNILESADNNNQRFNNNVDVTIEIYSEQYRTNDLSIVDNITSQVLNILMSNTSIPVLETANFQIFPKERTTSTYSPLTKGDNFIARKIITINNLVNQIS